MDGGQRERDEPAMVAIIADFARAINATAGDFDRSVAAVAERLAETLGDFCLVHLYDPEAETVRLVSVHIAGVPDETAWAAFPDATRPVNWLLFGPVLRSGETVFHPELDSRLADEIATRLHRRGLTEVQPHSLIAAPLRARDRVSGMVVMLRLHPRSQAYGRVDLELVGVLADLAAVALDNARLIGALRSTGAALHESDQRLQAIVAGAPVGILVRDPAGRTIEVNAAYADMLGYTREEVLASSLGAHVDPTSAVQGREAFERLISDGAPIGATDFRLRHRDGSAVEVRAHASLIRSAAGAPLYAVVIIEDVTGERALQARLRQAERLESLGRLAGGVAHDFNNLLTIILGFSDMTRRAVGPGHPAVAHLEQVTAAARQGAALTDQLLAFSRPRAADVSVFAAAELVERLSQMLSRLVRDDVLVEVSATGASRVAMDPHQLERVVINLVVNAGDAMPDGGRLSITVTPVTLEDHRPGTEPSLPAGRYVQIAVADTGEGMDSETQERIFEPFFTTKAAGRGTGLGLAGVLTIARAAGGGVAVRSAPGQGTTVALLLPEAEAADPAAAVVSAPGSGGERGRGQRVLVAEDEPALRALVADTLTDAGYEVLTAPDGRAALDRARAAGVVDLLVSDVMMPGLSGPELVARLREEQLARRAIHISGWADSVAAEITRRGDVPLLMKPFTPEELLAAVDRALQDAV